MLSTQYVDCETGGLDPRLDPLRIVAVDGHAYDTWCQYDLAALMSVLDPTALWVGHNIAFDLEFIQEHLGLQHTGPVFDTMVAWQILENGRQASASLDNVCRLLLQKQLSKEFQKGPWLGLVDNQMLDYAAEDTAILPPLMEKLQEGLHKAGLGKMMQLEMQLLPILVKSRMHGIGFDVPAAKELQTSLRKEAQALESELPNKLNPRSSQQVTAFFTLPNSEVDTLREHYIKIKDNPGKMGHYLNTVMEIRKKLKKISTIEKQLIGHVRADGRIHPSFTQCFTETGRLSSRNPNLQNQDRGEDIRSLFVPGEGNKFVIADYCVSPDTKVLKADLSWSDAIDIEEGDKLVGFDEASNGKSGKKYRETTVTNKRTITRPCYKITTDKGSIVASAEHKFWGKRSKGQGNGNKKFWVEAQELQAGGNIAFFVEPWEYDTSREAGYLSGFYDGEGWLDVSGRVGCAQNVGPTLTYVMSLLDQKEYDYTLSYNGNHVSCLGLSSKSALKLIGSVRPPRLTPKSNVMWEGKRIWGKNNEPATITNVEYVGEQEVVALRTGTGTLITNGFLSHNSSLEVRIAAMLAGEDNMLQVLWEGRDLHSETCARIFGEETKNTRTLSKNILFGSLFGGGHNTVIRFAAKSGVELTDVEAKKFQAQLFEAYPKLKDWHRKAGNTKPEYVYSLRGRRRYIPRGDGYCVRINHGVQASAADGQKLAMIELAKMGYTVVANVHDEILLQVSSDRADDALSDVERVMVDCMYRATKQDPHKPVVPIAVEGAVVNNWSEKK